MSSLRFAAVLTALVTIPACLVDVGDGELETEATDLTRKVKICHVPPGNPANAHTISVAQSAVAAHLGHGDGLGACVCPPGEAWDCYSAPLETDGIGTCQRGTKTCLADGTGYGACVGEVTPIAEVCGDGLDNDCDGGADEDCGGGCVPAPEVCGDGLDNDCDGGADEGCVCPPGETWDCYSAPLETDGIGTCQRGTKTCLPDGMGYGPCIGEVTPVPEVCGDGLDNDCDHTTDDGCSACVPEAEVCGDGIDNDCDGLVDDGCCVPEAEVCGDGLDNDCDGLVDDGCCVPAPEVCGDGIDNDCDGLADEGCVCAPGSAVACYGGPAGTAGVGVCMAGTMICAADGSGYGACLGEVTPGAEVCGDGLDNDCNGITDETCVCTPGSQVACYDGPPGTAGVGACHAGARTCAADGSGYGACTGQVTPAPEVCDLVDNDCDGMTDEGCLGDRAWNDVDRDGIQDAGEPGLAGTTVLLRTSSGAVVAIGVSSSSGAYTFSGVPAGSYYIEVIAPFSYTVTGKDAGTDDTADNDVDGESNATDVFIYSGAADYTQDAGFYFVIQS